MDLRGSGADCFDFRIAKKQNFDLYDAIVFGGWVCAGGVSKISWFRSKIGQWPGKTVIAFCTGGSPAESPEIEAQFQRRRMEKGSGVLLPRRVLL